MLKFNFNLAVYNPKENEPAYEPKVEEKKPVLKADDEDDEEYTYKPQVEEKKAEPEPKKAEVEVKREARVSSILCLRIFHRKCFKTMTKKKLI